MPEFRIDMQGDMTVTFWTGKHNLYRVRTYKSFTPPKESRAGALLLHLP